MTADYRKLILDEQASTPLSQMSGAFHNAKSEEAIMLAYYQSSMAVEWMIQNHGWDKLKAVLTSLAEGLRVNAAIEKHLGSMEKLEPAFATWFTKLAQDYAPDADFTKPDAPPAEYLKNNAKNLPALRALAEQALQDKDWIKAEELGRKIELLEPKATGAESGTWLRAKALHGMGKTEEETRLLRGLAQTSAEALPIFQRLMEVDYEAKRWPELALNARRAFAINPFLSDISERLAEAEAALQHPEVAVEHYRRALKLKPAHPAKIHFHIASLLKKQQPQEAKIAVLDALALAPRYKEALKLLTEL
jgi:tetratricopeptide (TPR) repeat protein